MDPTTMAIYAGGQIMGNVMNRNASNNQLAMQQKFMDMQIQGSKDLSNYNKNNTLDVWNRTNYQAQMEHLKKAGLNPGLLYSKGGQGGSTLSVGQKVDSGRAEYTGTKNAKMMEIATKIAEQSVQLKNIEADTKKKEAEAENISKGTEKTGAEIALLEVNTGNAKLDQVNKQINNDIADLNLELKESTLSDSIDIINMQLRDIYYTYKNKESDLSLKEGTINSNIEKAKIELAGVKLENTLKRWGIKMKPQELDLIKSKIYEISRSLHYKELDNQRSWENITQEIYRIGIDESLRSAGLNLTRRGQTLDFIKSLLQISPRYVNRGK
jgi:hypothetical protein